MAVPTYTRVERFSADDFEVAADGATRGLFECSLCGCAVTERMQATHTVWHGQPPGKRT